MSGGDINLLGDLGKPAEALINRISDAIGGIAQPWQIRRVAKAEAEAEVQSAIIRAKGQERLSELQERALNRLAREEARKQENIESISYKAIPHLSKDSSPEDLEQDWIANFFDQARNVSNDEVQEIWAKILAAEASQKDSIPISTISTLKNLGAFEAKAFERLLRLTIKIGDFTAPIVGSPDDEIVKRQGLNFDQLAHLEDLGLLNFDNLGGFRVNLENGTMLFPLAGRVVTLKLSEKSLPIGKVRLTFAGRQIAKCVNVKPDEALDGYLREFWTQNGVVISEPLDPAFNITTKVENAEGGSGATDAMNFLRPRPGGI